MIIVALLSACALKHADSVVKRKDLEGRPLAEAFDRIGKDTSSDDIQPASGLGGEYYTPLNMRFPINDPASRKVLIREVRWKRGDRYIGVLCTRENGVWTVIEAIEWQKDVQF